jgi:hypothetical protein
MFILAIATLLVVVPSNPGGNEHTALVDQFLNSWRIYEGHSVRGVLITNERESSETKESFVANYPRCEKSVLPKYEIGITIPNPGEPHITEPNLIVDSIGFVEGEFLHFERELVSRDPPGDRLSHLIMGAGGPSFRYYNLDNLLLYGLNGMAPRMLFGRKLESLDWRIEVLSEEEYLGIKCSKVRLKPAASEDPFTDWLVAREPNWLPLKLVGGSFEADTLKLFDQREVLSVKVIGGVLVANHARSKLPGDRFDVYISSVTSLPATHKGIYDYNDLTGVIFNGDYAKATRKGSPRIPYVQAKRECDQQGSNTLEYIPYSPTEQSLIREYILAKTQPRSPMTNWFRYGFYAIVAIASVYVVRCYLWRRKLS